MEVFVWEPVRYSPARNQLALPLDERGTRYPIERKNRRKEARAQFLATCSRCSYCGVVLKTGTIDHILPKSRGGTDNPANFTLACAQCNRTKADRTPEEWARDILAVVGKEYPQRPFSQRLRAVVASLAMALPFFAAKGGAA